MIGRKPCRTITGNISPILLRDAIIHPDVVARNQSKLHREIRALVSGSVKNGDSSGISMVTGSVTGRGASSAPVAARASAAEHWRGIS